MRFKEYTNVQGFYRDTYDGLMRHEAQDVIPLGNVIMGNEGTDKTDWRDTANLVMSTVENGEGIRFAAIKTLPDKSLTLYPVRHRQQDKCRHRKPVN